MAGRALLFIDGNNWYHSLRHLGLHNVAGLDYAALSRKLVGPSEWLGTRYYIGEVRQIGNTQLYADQRRFLASLRATDRRISCHLGRIEPRTVKDETAAELLQYLNHLPARLDPDVFHGLLALARRHQRATVMVEKAVDVTPSSGWTGGGSTAATKLDPPSPSTPPARAVPSARRHAGRARRPHAAPKSLALAVRWAPAPPYLTSTTTSATRPDAATARMLCLPCLSCQRAEREGAGTGGAAVKLTLRECILEVRRQSWTVRPA